MADLVPYIPDSITAFHQRETVYEESVSSRVKRFPRWHAKAPASVLLDKTVGNRAFRVYCAMALKTDKGICSVGVRYLGRILGTSGATVSRRIKDLIRAGHLEPVDKGNGQRASYRFISPVFRRICRQCKALTLQIGPDDICWLCSEGERRSEIA